MMVAYRRKYEVESRKLIEAEHKCEGLVIVNNSLEKQNEIQRKQLLDKIMQQNEQITAEKDTREIWINRYEKEQQAHIQTHTTLMALQTKYAELDL
jgi:lambda repressor-like predicted transcriptional regulator